VAVVILQARRQQRMSVRILLERMRTPISAPTYARFESGQRTVPDDTLLDICEALGMEGQQVFADAQRLTQDRTEAAASFVGPNLETIGLQIPAIRVRVTKMMSPEHAWLDTVRGMLRVHAAQDTDAAGDLLLEEPLIKTIAQILGTPLFDCWVGLSTFIERD